MSNSITVERIAPHMSTIGKKLYLKFQKTPIVTLATGPVGLISRDRTTRPSKNPSSLPVADTEGLVFAGTKQVV